MMADWANALLSGIGAAAKSGADSIDQQQRQQAAAEAEQRAADIKLATAERLMAIEEAAKNRAAERFSSIVKNKMGGTPLEVAPGDPAPQTAEGMLTKPSLEQATQSALEESLQNDPAAFMAGQGMLAQGVKGDLEERKIESREKIAAAETARKEKADAARERDSERRFEAMMARIAKSGSGGDGKGSKSALIQNAEYMRDVLKYPPEKIEAFIFDKKSISTEDIAARMLAQDKYGDLTAADAARKARELKAELGKDAPAAAKGAIANPFTPAAKPAANAKASATPVTAAPKRLKFNPATGKVE